MHCNRLWFVDPKTLESGKVSDFLITDFDLLAAFEVTHKSVGRRAFKLLTMAKLMKHKFGEAVKSGDGESFRCCLKTDPNNALFEAEVNRRLAKVTADSKLKMEYLNASIGLYPTKHALLERKECNSKNGNYSAALADLEKIKEIDPNFPLLDSMIRGTKDQHHQQHHQQQQQQQHRRRATNTKRGLKKIGFNNSRTSPDVDSDGSDPYYEDIPAEEDNDDDDEVEDDEGERNSEVMEDDDDLAGTDPKTMRAKINSLLKQLDISASASAPTTSSSSPSTSSTSRSASRSVSSRKTKKKTGNSDKR